MTKLQTFQILTLEERESFTRFHKFHIYKGVERIFQSLKGVSLKKGVTLLEKELSFFKRCLRG